ncbi:MAG: sulfotransferase [Gammaproteobacteria bacterium]|nr:sulfotransferase [Gammaproteobacteria bacterium]
MNSLIQQAEEAHRRGELATAKKLYAKLIDAATGNTDALYGMGTLLMQEGCFAEAGALLADALEREPQAADIAFNYAVCLRGANDLPAAIAMAERAGRAGGTDEGFSQNVSRLLIELNAPHSALAQLGSFPHQHLESQLLQAQALGLLEAWDRSVALLRKLQHALPQNSRVAQELALAAGRLRDYDLAIAAYEQYLSLITPGAVEYVKFADLNLLARKVERCAECLESAASVGADSSEFHLLCAKLARLRGDYASAVAASELSVARQPNNVEAWSVLLEISEDGELGPLLNRLQESIDTATMTAYERQVIEYVRGDACARLGDVNKAFSAYSEANSQQRASMSVSSAEYSIAAHTEQCEELIAQFSARHVCASEEGRPTPLFIVGMPRSGTTLVERLLAQLPQVTAGGENDALGFLASKYRNEVAAKLLPPPAEMTQGQWQALAQHYYDKTPQYREASIGHDSSLFVTDKMPQNFHHVGMILSLFPRARIVQLRRDPRDICWSIYTRMFPAGHNYACDFESLAHAVAVAQRLMDHWSTLAPDRVLDVTYESLVADPLQQGQRITNFCGLPWSDDCLNFHKKVSTSFTFSELQVRQAISEKRIGRWQAFETHLAPLVEALARNGCLD